MKTKFIPACFSLALLLLLPLGLAPALHADPPGPPAGAPGDTMKTLQELWDKMEALEAQNTALANQLNAIQGVVKIEMVTVGNAGNDANTMGYPNPTGAVSYEYEIGKYEVTNAQYAAFLNAVAVGTDPNSLYHSFFDGITLVGGTHPYAAKPFMGDKPVGGVNWFDCLRFCNWLHNGQPTGPQGAGTTEDGAYTLTGATSVATGTDPTHGATGRNAGARFFLPSHDEWYKAAYYEPGASTVDSNEYWLYPTRSDSAPTIATADVFGNINNDTASPPGIANYNSGVGNETTVGSGGTGSQSFYGAADMAGNIFEWIESQPSVGYRGYRGGSWSDSTLVMESSTNISGFPEAGYNLHNGFRVASAK